MINTVGERTAIEATYRRLKKSLSIGDRIGCFLGILDPNWLVFLKAEEMKDHNPEYAELAKHLGKTPAFPSSHT